MPGLKDAAGRMDSPVEEVFEPGDTEDREWVRSFQAGREEGFNRLVLKHKDKIYGLCLRMLVDRDDAEDAAQVAFVKAYRGLGDFRMDSKFSTWLYRIAVNTCKNRMASRSYRDARDHKDLEAVESEGYQASISRGPTAPDQVLEAKGKRERIEAAIARLPEEQRMLVVLRDVEGRSYEEIAESAGLNLGTVKSRLNRGRAQLQEWLREFFLVGLLLAIRCMDKWNG
jgi:RNA polymerase sigma-70 factor (ECF subfamily)